MYNSLQASFIALTLLITTAHADSNESILNDDMPTKVVDILIMQLDNQPDLPQSMSLSETEVSLTEQELAALADKELLSTLYVSEYFSSSQFRGLLQGSWIYYPTALHAPPGQ